MEAASLPAVSAEIIQKAAVEPPSLPGQRGVASRPWPPAGWPRQPLPPGARGQSGGLGTASRDPHKDVLCQTETPGFFSRGDPSVLRCCACSEPVPRWTAWPSERRSLWGSEAWEVRGDEGLPVSKWWGHVEGQDVSLGVGGPQASSVVTPGSAHGACLRQRDGNRP